MDYPSFPKHLTIDRDMNEEESSLKYTGEII